MDDDVREKTRQFKEELHRFNLMHGRENFKVPQIGGKELDLYTLFREVMNRGGYDTVCDNKQWKEIVNALDLPASCTSASFTLKNHYLKCLLGYESYYHKSQQQPNNFTFGLVTGGPNPAAITVNNNNTQITPSVSQPTPQQEQRYIGKKVTRNEPEYNLIFRYQGKTQTASRDKSYQKKVRLLNAIPDMRRIVLAFESHTTSEIMWALNILTLFSSNQNCNLLIENQPYLMESMTNYVYYCVNNLTDLYFIIDILEGSFDKVKDINKINSRSQMRKLKNSSDSNALLEDINNTLSLATIVKKNKILTDNEKIKKEGQIENACEEVTEYELMEYLITIILIIRNLSYTRANEPSIIKCTKFMNILYLLFIHSNVQEIRLNSLDIITNLSKHVMLKEIKYPINLLGTTLTCLKSSNKEVSEQALECFRRLTFPTGNEEFFEKMPDEFYEEMVSLLISYKIEVRESALEILYYMSDQKLETRTKIGKQYKCIQRLVALICSNSSDNRISKFAACTLAKLAEVPSILSIIMPYEQELFVAACTDDSITKIILGVISN